MKLATLHISLFAKSASPPPKEEALNEIWGGPETLLSWLETRLGLFSGSSSPARRITDYLGLLEGAQGHAYRESLQADPWSTAAQLLAIRDDLLLEGWDGQKNQLLPTLVNDLAYVEGVAAEVPSGVPDRINAVLEALDAGQQLPEHLCLLDEVESNWPPKWRSLLERLEVQVALEVEPSADEATALGKLQQCLTHLHDPVLSRDQSLVYMRSESRVAAAQILASILDTERSALGETVICCEDEEMARLIDGALAASNLPTAGVATHTRFHPASQVLPLSLALCREPVDPTVVLDFLALPLNPLPKYVATRLADALMDQPGIGSQAWQKVVDEVTSNADDSYSDVREQIEQWFHYESVPVDQPMPAPLVVERARQVAQWAIGHASHIENQHLPDQSALDQDWALIDALRSTATEARLVSELAGALGTELTGPQLQRIIDAVAGTGLPATEHPACEGGPTWVNSLAQVRQQYQRLIWVGLGSAYRVQPKWPRRDLEMFEQAGLEIDDGASQLGACREAEQRGLNRISQRALLLELPTDDEIPPHPLATTVRHGLASGEHSQPKPLSVDRLMAAGLSEELSPWRAEVEERQVLGPPLKRPLWHVEQQHLVEREQHSASELESRLGCPIQWIFNYRARLRSGPIANLPNNFLLKGNFSHFLLTRVFGDSHDLPEEEEAVRRIEAAFDERIGLEAAPLAQPARVGERRRLRAELVDATRTLVRVLQEGGWHIAEMEAPFDGTADGYRLNGFIDCRLENAEGAEAVVDFKYANYTRYQNLLAEGRAVQLAVYARGRAAAANANLAEMPVAYLVIANNRLLTPEANLLMGARDYQRVAEAPSMVGVWNNLVDALARAHAWMEGKTPVPARPLQGSEEWPDGVDLILDTDEKNEQRICSYCDFRVLCGLEAIN